jgi:predicted MPP superfamily phosphohydrolase
MLVSRRTVLKSLVAGGIGGVTGAGVYAVSAEDPIELSRVTLPVANLPPPLAGLRIGLLTDVHRSQWVSADDVVAASTLLMSTEPDLIVLGGDYVTWRDRQYLGSSAEALSALRAPLGVFAVLGNHDDEKEMPPALAAHGVEVLKDARTRIEIKGEPVHLAGLRYWTRTAGEVERLVRGTNGFVVLLAHDPRRLVEAQALNIPLVLSGHTHGGQVVLPLLGAIAAQRKFPVVAGMARRGGTTLFVSRGVGTVYVPVRVNCPPEVALLTLAPAV